MPATIAHAENLLVGPPRSRRAHAAVAVLELTVEQLEQFARSLVDQHPSPLKCIVFRNVRCKYDIPDAMRFQRRDPHIYFIDTIWQAGRPARMITNVASGRAGGPWSVPELAVMQTELVLPANLHSAGPQEDAAPSAAVGSNARIVRLGGISLDMRNLRLLEDMAKSGAPAAMAEAVVQTCSLRAFAVGHALRIYGQYLKDLSISVYDRQGTEDLNGEIRRTEFNNAQRTDMIRRSC